LVDLVGFWVWVEALEPNFEALVYTITTLMTIALALHRALRRFGTIGLSSGYSIYTPCRFEAYLVCCVLDGSLSTLPVSQVSNPGIYVLRFVMLVGLVPWNNVVKRLLYPRGIVGSVARLPSHSSSCCCVVVAIGGPDNLSARLLCLNLIPQALQYLLSLPQVLLQPIDLLLHHSNLVRHSL
jgi:hypothetical protein